MCREGNEGWLIRKKLQGNFRSAECNYPSWNCSRTPKRTLKVGKLSSISLQIAGQATPSLTRLVLVLFICLNFVNSTGQVLVTVIGYGGYRPFDQNYRYQIYWQSQIYPIVFRYPKEQKKLFLESVSRYTCLLGGSGRLYFPVPLSLGQWNVSRSM
jgi:hypothetical protein